MSMELFRIVDTFPENERSGLGKHFASGNHVRHFYPLQAYGSD